MLKREEYEVLENVFGDDVDICKEVEEYGDDCYITNIIAEVADSNIPIYNNILCNYCWELSSYVEEAREEGAFIGETDLFTMLRVGAYEYYKQLLYNNLNAITLNIAKNHLNSKFKDAELDEIDINDLLRAVWECETIEEIKQNAEDFVNCILGNN